MAKLVLLSIVIMMFTLPIAAGRQRNARRGISRMLVLVFLFNLVYLFLVRYIYPRLMY
jgi:Kef-type K+ transport system membrane component KefB